MEKNLAALVLLIAGGLAVSTVSAAGLIDEFKKNGTEAPMVSQPQVSGSGSAIMPFSGRGTGVFDLGDSASGVCPERRERPMALFSHTAAPRGELRSECCRRDKNDGLVKETVS